MNAFEITVQRRAADGWPVVAEQSASGVFLPARTEGLLQVDLEELKAQLLSQATARDYGTLLGRALFRDEVRDAFAQALPKGDDRLHVLLFVEDAELKGLRWERLCAPLGGGWDFLALHQRVPFSLYLPSTTDQRFPPIGRRDLRALVVVANPGGLEKYRLAPFDAAATVASVRAALGGVPSDMLAALPGAAGPPTLDALCERITEQRYTLLHVVAHGQFKPADGETVLYLANADNQVDPVPGTRLLGRLKQLRGARGLPHFAFLSACESAVADPGPALGGLAQRLVGELGMPAVLAMTEKVSVATAQALAEAFYRRLRETGEPDRALVEACAGLAERYDVTVPALYSRLGGRPLFSDTPDRPLTVAEIQEGLARVRALLDQRAPVWLGARPDRPRPVFEEAAALLEATLHAELKDLSEQARKDRARALDEIGNLCEEALERSFTELALGKEPPPYDERCPFRGLYPFRTADREFFFGREALVDRLLVRLAESNFLAVLGPSGSGKSSVVLAGLVPALQARENNLQPAYMTPGSDPLDFLEAVLQADGRASLLVVDQFEELFTLCADEGKRRAFLDRLLQLPETMQVVLTMRADFWGECAPYPALKGRMQAHQELIAPMDATELRRAMEMQAAKVGLRFEADLSSAILDDVEGEPGAMPLLQHALRELWKRRHGRWLRADEYRAIGGVRRAIAETAEAVYRDLPPPDQARVQDVFVRLARLDEDDAAAEARRDTRQRVRLDDLDAGGSDPTQTKALVHRLADARLIVTTVNAATGREEVEVAHEALIRYWQRLREWLDEDRADLRLWASVRLATQEWQKNRAEESLLTHHGARLIEGERLLAHARLRLTKEEVAYLGACKNRQERQAQRERRYQRRIVQVSVACAVLAIGLAAWALVQRNQAEEARTATENTLAKELFRPLGRQPGGLNPAELSALAALSALPGTHEGVRARFVKGALADPANARRFANRISVALQAAVGLDRGVAAKVVEVLRKRLKAPSESTQIQTAALAIAELDLADDDLRELAAGVLVTAAVGDDPLVPIVDLTRSIGHVTRHLPPDRAAALLAPAAELLTGALAKSDPSAQQALALGLAEVCKGLPPGRAAALLLHGVTRYPELHQWFIPLLVDVAGRSSLQDSVGVLKHPLCYGEARLLFLHRVEQIAGQQFQTSWEMADWLSKNHPETEAATPQSEMD
jgi:energy-coupling factor transporter ATP-binding protein EcfA2